MKRHLLTAAFALLVIANTAGSRGGMALAQGTTPVANTSARDQADSHILAGVELLKQTNKHTQAIKHFQAAITLQPKYALAYLWLGDAYEKWGDAAPPNSNARLSRYATARKSYGDALQYAAPDSLDAKDARRKRATVEGKISQTVIGPPIRIYLNGQLLSLPLRPILRSGKVMVPLDALMTAIGARKSGYDPLANTITYEVDGRTVQVQVNVRVATVREKSGDLENQRRVILAIPLTEVRSVNRDYAMIETTFFREALGADVQYNAAGRTVRITTKGGGAPAATPQIVIGTLLQVDPVEPVTLRLNADGREQTFTATAAVPVVGRAIATEDGLATALLDLKAEDFAEKLALSDLKTDSRVAIKFQPGAGVQWVALLKKEGGPVATPTPGPTPVPTPPPAPQSVNPPEKLFEKDAHAGGAQAIAVTPDGSTLATGGADRTVKIWKLGGGEPQLTETLTSAAVVRAIAFSPDGSSVAAGCDDRTVRVWNVQNGKQTQNLTGHMGPVERVAFSADGVLLAAGSREESAILPHGEVRLWHAASGQLKQKLPELQSGCSGLAFSKNGLLATASGRFYVDIWKQEGGSYDYDKAFLERWSVTHGIAFSPDGQYLAAANEDGTLRLWSMFTTIESLRWTSKAEANLLSIAYSGDGKTIVTGGDNGGMNIWSAREGKMLASWAGAPLKTGINAIATDRSGKIFSAATDGKIAGWQLK